MITSHEDLFTLTAVNVRVTVARLFAPTGATAVSAMTDKRASASKHVDRFTTPTSSRDDIDRSGSGTATTPCRTARTLQPTQKATPSSREPRAPRTIISPATCEVKYTLWAICIAFELCG